MKTNTILIIIALFTTALRGEITDKEIAKRTEEYRKEYKKTEQSAKEFLKKSEEEFAELYKTEQGKSEHACFASFVNCLRDEKNDCASHAERVKKTLNELERTDSFKKYNATFAQYCYHAVIQYYLNDIIDASQCPNRSKEIERIKNLMSNSNYLKFSHHPDSLLVYDRRNTVEKQMSAKTEIYALIEKIENTKPS